MDVRRTSEHFSALTSQCCEAQAVPPFLNLDDWRGGHVKLKITSICQCQCQASLPVFVKQTKQNNCGQVAPRDQIALLRLPFCSHCRQQTHRSLSPSTIA